MVYVSLDTASCYDHWTDIHHEGATTSLGNHYWAIWVETERFDIYSLLQSGGLGSCIPTHIPEQAAINIQYQVNIYNLGRWLAISRIFIFCQWEVAAVLIFFKKKEMYQCGPFGQSDHGWLLLPKSVCHFWVGLSLFAPLSSFPWPSSWNWTASAKCRQKLATFPHYNWHSIHLISLIQD